MRSSPALQIGPSDSKATEQSGEYERWIRTSVFYVQLPPQLLHLGREQTAVGRTELACLPYIYNYIIYIYIRVFLKNESLRTMFSNPPLHYAGHREAVVKIIAQNNNI